MSDTKISVDWESRVDELRASFKAVQNDIDKTKQTIKETNTILDEQAKTSAKTKMSWTDFRSAYQTVLDVMRVGNAIWDETGQKYVDNAVLVGNLARSLGTTTEEASRLKEVADDVGISIDSLKTSLKLAMKDGVEANIDGLAKLADEYNALAPGVERTQFLLDKFGRSGEEMGKLLEKGGDSIKEMSAAMDEGLVVTQEAYEQARHYQISVDSLKDSWDALTYKAAPPLVNALTKIINDMRDSTRAVEMAKEAGESWGLQTGQQQKALLDAARAEREQADAAILAAEAANEAGGAFETESEMAARLAEESKNAEQAIKDVTKANQDMLNLIGDLTNKQTGYAEKQAEVQQALNDGKITLDEAKAKWKELADEQELASRRMILQMLEQQLMEDGLSASETGYLLDLGLKWGIYSDTAVLAAKAAMDEVASLKSGFDNLPTEKNITITTTHLDSYLTNYANQEGIAHASGGSFMIPQSYGNEGFRLGNMDTASGGELISITPNGQAQQAGGMTFNVNLNGSFADPEEQARKFTSIVKRILRQENVSYA